VCAVKVKVAIKCRIDDPSFTFLKKNKKEKGKKKRYSTYYALPYCTVDSEEVLSKLHNMHSVDNDNLPPCYVLRPQA
jgi:hypothetical protein